MLKGLFSGTFFGAIFGGILVVVASLTAPQPPGNAPPEMPQTAAPVATSGETGPADGPTAATEPDPATDLAAVPQVAAPAADDSVATNTAPPAAPATSAVDGALAAPVAVAEPDVAATPLDRPLPNPQSLVPQPPQSETDVIVSTRPANPAPIVEVPEPATVETVLVVPDEEISPTLESAVREADTAMQLTDAPALSPATQTADAPDVAASPAPAIDAGSAAGETLTLRVPDAADGLDVSLTAPTAPDVVATAPEAAPSAPEPDSLPVTPEVSEAPVLAPAVEPETAPGPPVVVRILEGGENSLPGGTGTVRINRALDDGTSPEDEVAAPPVAEDLAEDATALERYAASFAAETDKPLMAIVLIDDGSLVGAAGAVAELPYPVSVAIAAGYSAAADLAAAYRDRGLEVAAIADLPDGAQPADVEIALESVFAILPEAIALLDYEGGTLQENRALATQTVDRLMAEGRGLVTVSGGLNIAQRAATSAGLPHGAIYRDLDSDGQTSAVIRRFLDQAAFRARQDGSVVLLGRVRADTLSALALWSTANRASEVSIAPLSAVLLSGND